MLRSSRAYGSGLYGFGLYGVSEFATLVEGVEYTAAWKVNLALPAAASAYNDVTLAVERVEIDASTTTDLPEGSRFQVGYPAMECSFTLSGMVDQRDASKTAAWLFGRYSTTSPLYHADAVYSPVTVDLGLYTSASAGTPELIRKFTGVVDSYVVNDDGSVEFTCIDQVRAELRSVPASPVVVTAPPYNSGLTAEYQLDALLRAATRTAVSTWPAKRPNCLLAAGLRTSVWPEVGTFDPTLSPTTMAPTFTTDGPYGSGMLTTDDPLGVFGPIYYQMSGGAGDDFYAQFLVKGLSGQAVNIHLGASGTPTDAWEVNVMASDAALNSQVIRWTSGAPDVYSVATGVDTAVHLVEVMAHVPVGSASWTTTVRVDGVNVISTGTRTAAAVRTTRTWDIIYLHNVSHVAAVAGFQVSNENAPATSYPFTPQAVLDPSLSQLTVLPAIDAGDPFQIIQQIADAELGVAGGDESGIFRFYNRNTLRSLTSQRDITSATSLTAISGQETSAAGVVNHATVEFTPWSFASARSTVWQATSAVKVAANSTRMLTVTSEGLFAKADLGFAVLPDGSGTVTSSRFRAATSKAGTVEHPGPAATPPTVTVTTAQTTSSTAVLTMVNSSNQDAWFVSPANYADLPVGTPLLRLAALVVTQGDSATREFVYPPDPTTTRFGDQATEISGDMWIQDEATALQFATDIVVDQCVPRPNFTGLAIVPDPRIQLTDVAHVLDPDRTGVDEYVRVFGWSIVWEAPSDPQSAMTYDMTIDGRTLAAPGGWIMGVAGRSEIGSTAYVYNGA